MDLKMNKFLDIIIPRFIEEKVAIVINEDNQYEVLCCEKDLLPNDEYDFLATAKSFNFFGFALFAKIQM